MTLRGEVRPLSVAPMMDRTDRFFRSFLRILTRQTLLYTEMVTTGALLRGDRDRFLDFDDAERPLSLQLGGDDPEELRQCARWAEERGYDEVNLNVGCPSDRVQSGRFGACLMARPEHVKDAVAAMRAEVDLPVTVKHRIGIDDLDRYEDMRQFVEVVREAEADRFSVHARKAWLSGLSPKQNREIPPLRYHDVYRLKREFPGLVIEINGGVLNLQQAEEHLGHVDAVMIGRAAYDDPWIFAQADPRFFAQDAPVASRRQAITAYLPYVEAKLSGGIPLAWLTRHLLQLFTGRPGARVWRRMLTEGPQRPGAGPEVFEEAMDRLADEVLDEPPGITDFGIA
ncbi:MAG: tRNA dihydrouridine(20/20a) synthase DusA [Thermoanaerobaculia bacterium]|nr:tRNA dihydrouridine(20/20a) synthase DusA [Thermoanaerobaculia bacterium]